MNLNKRQISNQLYKISDFIAFTDVANAQEQLLDLLYTAISSEHLEDLDIGSEIVIMSFYKKLVGLLDAIHWLGNPMIEAFRTSIADDMTLEVECPYLRSFKD